MINIFDNIYTIALNKIDEYSSVLSVQFTAHKWALLYATNNLKTLFIPHSNL
jgi:hypothetical protein